MKQKPKELDWEITFGGMVLDYYMCCGSNGFAKANPKYEKLVDFIDNLLTQQRTELLEEILGLVNTYWKTIPKDELVEKINKL